MMLSTIGHVSGINRRLGKAKIHAFNEYWYLIDVENEHKFLLTVVQSSLGCSLHLHMLLCGSDNLCCILALIYLIIARI